MYIIKYVRLHFVTFFKLNMAFLTVIIKTDAIFIYHNRQVTHWIQSSGLEVNNTGCRGSWIIYIYWYCWSWLFTGSSMAQCLCVGGTIRQMVLKVNPWRCDAKRNEISTVIAVTHAITVTLLPMSADVNFSVCFISFRAMTFIGTWTVYKPDSSTWFFLQ